MTAAKKKKIPMTTYRVQLTYEATVIIASDANPDSKDFEQCLALEAEQYVSPVMDLIDWKVRPARPSDGAPVNE